MKRKLLVCTALAVGGILINSLYACKDETPAALVADTAVKAAFGGKIELNNLLNYAAQAKPAYITKDNTSGNPVTNKGATLGRVLKIGK